KGYADVGWYSEIAGSFGELRVGNLKVAGSIPSWATSTDSSRAPHGKVTLRSSRTSIISITCARNFLSRRFCMFHDTGSVSTRSRRTPNIVSQTTTTSSSRMQHFKFKAHFIHEMSDGQAIGQKRLFTALERLRHNKR
ncbi:hypothetical protein J6590_064439, partial [Homalodisca vitripennis]